jgi:hypothetical protein
MHDIVNAIGGFVIWIMILGCIPYGIWILYSLLAKKWKRVGRQIAVPVAVYACLAGVSAISNSQAQADYLAGPFDAKADLGSAVFEYDSKRAFNGDCHSFSVNDLPE